MAADFQQQTLISGIVQLVIGCLCLLLGIVELATFRATILAIFGTSIWGSVWIIVTGILGIVAKQRPCGSLKCMAGVYMAFSITAIVFVCLMIIIYSFTVAFGGHVVAMLILLLSISEFGVAIWACFCTCMIVRCCSPPDPRAPSGAVLYTQRQEGPPVTYVITQGPDGTPVAVPAQPGGPMMVPGGTPVYSQGGGAAGTSVPPHYQATVQQPSLPQNEEKVAL